MLIDHEDEEEKQKLFDFEREQCRIKPIDKIDAGKNCQKVLDELIKLIPKNTPED
jgi:hypothetical protein